MKAQMEIKTDDRSLFTREANRAWNTRKKGKQNTGKRSAKGRWALCALLITILAVSGFVGASPDDEPKMTAAPVVGKALEQVQAMTFDEVQARYDAQRGNELEILDGVLADESADKDTKKKAQEQKIQIAARMDTETKIEETLAHMGFSRCAAVCADERVILIIPQNLASDQAETTRIIDAAASIGGCEAKDVKIILVKNEEEDCATDKNLLY